MDVSSYLLFEATGDSEALSDPPMDPHIASQIPLSDDDAQSCCYDASEACHVGEVMNRSESDDEKKEDEAYCAFGASYYDDDDEDDMQEEHEASVSADSEPELVDEMEKNRLFWEACLAS